jgi:hypothetical protein
MWSARPSFTTSAIAPHVSSTGIRSSRQCTWYRSTWSVCSRASELWMAVSIPSGWIPEPSSSGATLVKIRTSSRRPAMARATSSSEWPWP